MSRPVTPATLKHADDPSAVADGTSTNARYALVEGIRIFYREAGKSSAPTLLLLHGFPTSSHMYRQLIPILATQYHVIAPDMPGFGFTQLPDRDLYRYSFDNLARTMDAFMDTLRVPEYAIQVFDYGAPVGFRLALAHPDRITALISQNGNAYLEGLSAGWDPIQRYWRDPSHANRSALRALLTPESVKWQYTHGVADATLIAPESYVLDSVLLTRPQVDEIQLDLFLDYAGNVALYPAFQQYFRSHKPPLLAVWGQNDPFFSPPGAQAFQRDVRHAEIHFYDTGHFALETHCQEIGATILEFLDRSIP